MYIKRRKKKLREAVKSISFVQLQLRQRRGKRSMLCQPRVSGTPRAHAETSRADEEEPEK